LKPHLWLALRVGLAFPHSSKTLVINSPFSENLVASCRDTLRAYEPSLTEQGVLWTKEKLCARLRNPRFLYGLHATSRLLLISSPRIRRGVPYTLLCGFFPRNGLRPSHRDVREVTRAACQQWGRPLFVYPGVHNAIPKLPGWKLPHWLRPSTMLVQLRDFQPEKHALKFDRYQPLDFDFA